MNFKNLHYQKEPLLICNVWDVPSTKIAEKLKFQAVGTSSAAIAAILGYNDGEEIGFSELELFVKRITTTTSIPLSVDIEGGYSRDTSQIIDHIFRLEALGVQGINIEDSFTDITRKLINADIFSRKLAKIKEALEKANSELFLNIRTDTFLLDHPNVILETEKRIKLYENNGADGIFIPGITKLKDIAEIVQFTKLPLNVMCLPNLPGFSELSNLGVQRISMGNFLFDKMYSYFEDDLNTIQNINSFKPIF